MKNKLDFIWLKKPAKIYFFTMLIGILISLIFEKAYVDNGHHNFFDMFGVDNFLSIFKNNLLIILQFYISIIFTNKIAYWLYAVNGVALGYSIGIVLKSNIKLFLLILPHGIFEIPCILATGYIIYKGEKFIRTNFKKYALIFFLHTVMVAFCAAVESFITPLFQCML